MVLRYGARLWKLRVLQAELKMLIRSSPNSPPTALRLCIANDSGYYLDINLYTEVVDPETGIVSFGGQNFPEGFFECIFLLFRFVLKRTETDRGLCTDCPYPRRIWLRIICSKNDSRRKALELLMCMIIRICLGKWWTFIGSSIVKNDLQVKIVFAFLIDFFQCLCLIKK